MAILSDIFDGSNGTLNDTRTTTTGGHTYAANVNYKIQDNRLYVESNGGSLYQEIIGFTSDSEYSFELEFHELTEAGLLGIAFCSDATVQNGYLIRMRSGAARLELSKVTGGSFSNFQSHLISVPNGTDLETVRVDVTATQVLVFYGGTQVITFTDSTHTRAGKFVFRSSASSSTTGWHLNSLSYFVPSIPVISDLSVTDVQSTTATVNVTTDADGGTLYCYLSENRTESEATIKTSSINQLVPTSGAQVINLTDLNDSAFYFAHVLHAGTGGDSNVLVSEPFYTPATNYTYGSGVYPLHVSLVTPSSGSDTDTGTLTIDLQSIVPIAMYHRKQFNRG